MADHDEVYGDERLQALLGMIRSLVRRIEELDRSGQLLSQVPELLDRLGALRSELFHYEVRSTYDTPEVAEHRKLIENARETPDFLNPDPEDDDPWRKPRQE